MNNRHNGVDFNSHSRPQQEKPTLAKQWHRRICIPLVVAYTFLFSYSSIVKNIHCQAWYLTNEDFTSAALAALQLQNPASTCFHQLQQGKHPWKFTLIFQIYMKELAFTNDLPYTLWSFCCEKQIQILKSRKDFVRRPRRSLVALVGPLRLSVIFDAHSNHMEVS